jgi:hypothetical protein
MIPASAVDAVDGSSTGSANDGLWHKADVQPLAVLGPLTGA